MTDSTAEERSERKFGPLLRAAREAAELRQRDVADRSGIPQTRLSRMEKDPPLAMPTPEQARTLADLYQLDDDDRAFILQAADDHAGRKDRRYHVMAGTNVLSTQRLFTLLEREAKRLRAFSAGVVPGSAQTPRYVAAIMGEDDEAGPSTQARLPRLIGHPANAGKQYELVLTESAAVIALAADNVMAEQFEELVRLSERPNVDLRIIRRGTRLTPWTVPAITIYDDGPVVLGQLLDGYIRFDEGEDLATKYIAEFERLQAAAAGGDEAREALRDIAAWYRSRD
jgi:transcriptional regulator with XRE-family HTH domain